MTTNKRLRIAIIGAGIGGLTLSAALGFLNDEQDLEINIYEASSHISEIGAGINFWPRAWNVLCSIGLEKKLLRILPQAPDDSIRLVFEVRKGDQPEGIFIQNMTSKGGSVRFHRAELQQVLLDSLSGYLHLSHRLISYEEIGEEVIIQFEGGKTATCDLLVGMDGIKSTVRKYFLSKEGLSDSPSVHPTWSGDIAYRGLIPIEQLEAVFPGHRAITTPLLYTGKTKHVITYPISSDKLINFVGLTAELSKVGTDYDGPTAEPCSQDDLLSIFHCWEEEVHAMLRCIKNPIKWVVRSVQPMNRFSRGRVILAGDAAHAMVPHQGAGAGRAVEDAYILACLISDKLCTREVIPRVSEIYNTICCPAANLVAEKSRKSGRLCQLHAPGLEDVREGDSDVPLEKLEGVYQQFSSELEWVWKESAEVDRARALAMLRSLEVVDATHGL
ncbi:hypothetical protein GALMADRAFT_1241914 [Galerina marginata CBS 339.88]|uniref:FAD-binding domain-containing protein n=1 Tax=Galerina marginata (strain CBS 339.88) TaxID=685588 RepID=A0A067T8I0_GALM3|nr:hypothetical protein GALMADRAFT_1241914 [Galerina marginata CBS 339.88]